MVLLSSLVVLFAIASMVAIAPGAFADHHMQTVTNAPGSSTPGCEDTADGCFIPSPVTIPMGGTVTWENNDTAAHTATGGSATEGPSGVFDSSLIMAGSSFSHTFDAAGTFDYFCMVHPWMAGTVIVEDAAAAAADAAAADAAAAEAAAAEAAAAEAAAADAAAAAAAAEAAAAEAAAAEAAAAEAAADAAAADAAAADAAAEAAAAEAAAADAAAADAAAADAAAEAAAADAAAADAAAAEAAAADAAAAEAAAADAAAAEAAAAKAEYKVNNPPIDFTDTLSYSISSGSVLSIISNSDDATLVVAIDTSDDGELSINLDNDNITAFDDGSYFVLVNNEEVEFSQDGNDLTIPYEAGTEKIEIVASAVVPEFGTIAMIVLAVAIVSIIVLTTKTRTTLIPKL
jgi:predicted secreted protein with PEFG-CTERM motif